MVHCSQDKDMLQLVDTGIHVSPHTLLSIAPTLPLWVSVAEWGVRG